MAHGPNPAHSLFFYVSGSKNGFYSFKGLLKEDTKIVEIECGLQKLTVVMICPSIEQI